MHQRCSLPSNRHYADYGGRGIHVCPGWAEFSVFYADMGNPPFPQASLDRINNDGGYSKENCRWATRSMQARNKRNTRLFSFRGHNLILSDWAKLTGIKLQTLTSRIYIYSLTIDQALTTPVQASTLPGRPIVFTPNDIPQFDPHADLVRKTLSDIFTEKVIQSPPATNTKMQVLSLVSEMLDV